jgi:hypothetical protein
MRKRMVVYPFICEYCAKSLRTRAIRIRTDNVSKYFCSKKCLGKYLVEHTVHEDLDFLDIISPEE